MNADSRNAPLAAQVRKILETTPEAQLPITYQQLADDLGLGPPRTIQRVAMTLEALMREDAGQRRPFIAALVISRRGEGLPAKGFFDLAVELERFPPNPVQHASAYHAEFRQALAQR
ncbi:hypothetical protein VRRI112168_01100 [Vreelandella rituensis]|uniref:Uncharacterized protein n=1 Tax=Vreelandella rituensis TaxID=2282306 RepID=A0A368U924_9GAMM|nr:hypothetical protein [Halomonas rituensis]RCV93455.1 hypothetical protein DU506_02230 [Halomonas rituensis]